ncbi:MAG: hypothetical protein J3Q66DRAFT_409242 [Benniella sp.]|nr:MAG: hypothetical protein J3Q66DRAFT_409242 [Benniella sp.]
MEDKIRIMVEENPGMSKVELAEHLGVPRTTMIIILKNKETLLGHPTAGLISDPYRKTEARFKILEKVLSIWYMDQSSRHTHVKRTTIMAQAYDIYRMLSGLRAEPLPPCLFTPGWLKGFKKRYRTDLAGIHADIAAVENIVDTCGFMMKTLSRYHRNDIYACEMTSMYLSLAPSLLRARGTQEDTHHETYNTDAFSASVMLCFNANGSDKRDPLVLVRQNVPDISKVTKYHEMVLGTDGEDLNMPTLLGWLVDFDRSLTRPILLVVDEAIWDILTRDSKEFQSILKMIEIIRAPTAKSKELPLNAGLAKMFKEVYYRRLLEVLRSHAEASNPKVDLELYSLDDYLSLISEAWERISDEFIGSCFTPFLSVPQQGQVSMASRLDDATSVALCSELKRAFPKAPDSAFQYYKNLEKGTGPSGFLREKIMSMQDHEDFFECFGAPSFGSSQNWGFVQAKVFVLCWHHRIHQHSAMNPIRLERLKHRLSIERRSPNHGPNFYHIRNENHESPACRHPLFVNLKYE